MKEMSTPHVCSILTVAITTTTMETDMLDVATAALAEYKAKPPAVINKWKGASPLDLFFCMHRETKMKIMDRRRQCPTTPKDPQEVPGAGTLR